MLHLQVVGSGKQGGLHLPGEADIVEGPLVLPDGLAVVGHLAAVLSILGGKDAQKGGFARPVAPNEAVDFSRLNGEVQIVEDLLVLIGLAQPLCL